MFAVHLLAFTSLPGCKERITICSQKDAAKWLCLRRQHNDTNDF